MTDHDPITTLTDEQISTILAQAEAETLGGWIGAIVRAAMGTLVLVVALGVMERPDTAGQVLLGAFLCACLVAYITLSARSAATRHSPRASGAPPKRARGVSSRAPSAKATRTC